jgi:hypothetical protein
MSQGTQDRMCHVGYHVKVVGYHVKVVDQIWLRLFKNRNFSSADVDRRPLRPLLTIFDADADRKMIDYRGKEVRTSTAFTRASKCNQGNVSNPKKYAYLVTLYNVKKSLRSPLASLMFETQNCESVMSNEEQ